jgi:cell volume regulation protein A
MQVRVRERLAQAIISVSAFNDVMSAIVTFAVVGVAFGSGCKFSLGRAAFDLGCNALIGVVIGIALGYAAAFLFAHEKFGFLVKYAPLITLMTVMEAYLSAQTHNASGFMAVFVFGIMHGNKKVLGFAIKPGEQGSLTISSPPQP